MDLEARLLEIEARLEALESKQKSKRFVKPTVAEVADYMRDCCRKHNIQTNADPQMFFNHYEGIGWKVARNPMKKWKSVCANWVIRARCEKKQDYVTDMRQRTEKTRKEGRPKDLARSLFGWEREDI